MGRSRRPGGRHAAGHRRCAAHHGAGDAPCRRRHRLDAAGSRPHRRAAGRLHVQAGRDPDPRDRREHGDLRLPPLRHRLGDLRTWRRPAEAERLGVPFLGEVPLTMSIREFSDAGRPVVAVEPDSPHAALYKAMAAQVKSALAGAGTPRRAAHRDRVMSMSIRGRQRAPQGHRPVWIEMSPPRPAPRKILGSRGDRRPVPCRLHRPFDRDRYSAPAAAKPETFWRSSRTMDGKLVFLIRVARSAFAKKARLRAGPD